MHDVLVCHRRVRIFNVVDDFNREVLSDGKFNSERAHESLNNMTPEEYRLMAQHPEHLKFQGTKTVLLTSFFLISFVEK